MILQDVTFYQGQGAMESLGERQEYELGGSPIFITISNYQGYFFLMTFLFGGA